MEQKVKRLGCVRWLALPALLFAVLQLSAALSAFNTPPELATRVTLSPVFLGMLLLFWAFLFGKTGVLLLWQVPNALATGARVLLIYLLIETLRYVLFAQSDYARGRLVFVLSMALSIAIIPFSYLVYRQIKKHGSYHGE
jgi:hypothetical protein